MTVVADSFPFRKENAGYVPTSFVIQDDEINSSFEPAEQLAPRMTIAIDIKMHSSRSRTPSENNRTVFGSADKTWTLLHVHPWKELVV
jgi:hypothetical protein